MPPPRGQAMPNVSAPNVASPDAPSAEDIRHADSAQPADRMAMIQAMVARLAGRLSQSPRDVDGWIRLMRSRQVLGQDEAAEQAFRSALDVFKDDPQEQARISTAARELGLTK
jgi:cytochrome c-type biogenesis protein CcmH